MNERRARHAPASPGRFSGDLDTYPILTSDNLDLSDHPGHRQRAACLCAADRHKRAATAQQGPPTQAAGVLPQADELLMYDDTLEGLQGQLTLSNSAARGTVQGQMGISKATAFEDHPNQVRGQYVQGNIPDEVFNWLPPHPQTPWWMQQDEAVRHIGVPGAPSPLAGHSEPVQGRFLASSHQHQHGFQASQHHHSDQRDIDDNGEQADDPEEAEYPPQKVWSRPSSRGQPNDTELEEDREEGNEHGEAERRDSTEHDQNPQQRNRTPVDRRNKSPEGEVAPQKKKDSSARNESSLAQTKYRRRSKQSHRDRPKRQRRTTKSLESTTTNIVENKTEAERLWLHDDDEQSVELERSDEHRGSSHRNRSGDRPHPSGHPGTSRQGTLTRQGSQTGRSDTGEKDHKNESRRKHHENDGHDDDHDHEDDEDSPMDRHHKPRLEASTPAVHTPRTPLPPSSTLTSPQPSSTQPSPGSPTSHQPSTALPTPSTFPTRLSRPRHQIPPSAASAVAASANRVQPHRQGAEGGSHRPAGRPLPSLEHQPPKPSFNHSAVAVRLLFAALARAGSKECGDTEHYYSSPRVWMDNVGLVFCTCLSLKS